MASNTIKGAPGHCGRLVHHVSLYRSRCGAVPFHHVRAYIHRTKYGYGSCTLPSLNTAILFHLYYVEFRFVCPLMRARRTYSDRKKMSSRSRKLIQKYGSKPDCEDFSLWPMYYRHFPPIPPDHSLIYCDSHRLLIYARIHLASVQRVLVGGSASHRTCRRVIG